MQAGVVRKKYCRLDYCCEICHFDRTLKLQAQKNRTAAASGEVVSGLRGRIRFWQDMFKRLPARQRPCIHYLKKRIRFRPCLQEYRCGNCEFDQFFDDQYTVHAMLAPVEVLEIEGFHVPQGYYLHPGHAWLKIEDQLTVTIGLDDFAHRLLGPFTRIKAPLIGKKVVQDQPGLALLRSDQTAEMLSPVSGVVTAVNPELHADGCRKLQQQPYADGWILRVHTTQLRQDMARLLMGHESADFIRQEIAGVLAMVEEVSGPLAADGGFLASDICGKLPQIGWERLARRFLRSG